MNNNYISMCREAKELQDDWEPKNHDACWWKSWNEFKYEIPSVDYVNLNSSVEDMLNSLNIEHDRFHKQIYSEKTLE